MDKIKKLNAHYAHGRWYCVSIPLPPDDTYVLAQEEFGDGHVRQEFGWLKKYEAFPGTNKSNTNVFTIEDCPKNPLPKTSHKRWQQIRSNV